MRQKRSLSRRGKRPDTRPAKKRYWRPGRLREKKIRNMVRNGMDRDAAEKQWDSTRRRYHG